MKTNKKVISFVGPSGVGKTSYAKRLIEKHDFVLPTVATTRCPRTDDSNHYLYVTEATFLKMAISDNFIEWDNYLNY